MDQIFIFTEYLPEGCDATQEQQINRDICYDFKEGTLIQEVKEAFVETVEEITMGQKEGWTICFIPASTSDKTKRRFSKLADVFRKLGYSVKENAIYNEFDTEAEHVEGKSEKINFWGFDGTAVNGQNVILIDAIIDRGITFQMTADKLKELGALSVTGLICGKTINPDWNSTGASYDDYAPCYDDYDLQTYDDYNDSYAQSVEGWSDQEIDEVFEGDPDAYWNID